MKSPARITVFLLLAAGVLASAGGQAFAQFIPPPDLVERAERLKRQLEQRNAPYPPDISQPKKDDPKKGDRAATDSDKARQAEERRQKVVANHKQAAEWYAKTRNTFAPAMHLVETEHFLIFSAWSTENDKALKDICEKLYGAMCRQFDIPKTESLWMGKCPLYVFWEEKHYKLFTTTVDGRNQPDAAGYNAQRGDFTYIVLNRCDTRTVFYATLVHETTHAFLGRYRSNRFVPRWLNEGLAEYMAATLVPECAAAEKYVEASRLAVEENRGVDHVFKTVEMNGFDYGIAQSLVRFLIARNRIGFVKLIQSIKDGREEAEALQASFHLTHEQLLKDWRDAAAHSLPPKKP